MCHWYSYNVNHDLCVHWKNCEIRDEQTEYVSGQSECPNIPNGPIGPIGPNSPNGPNNSSGKETIKGIPPQTIPLEKPNVLVL